MPPSISAYKAWSDLSRTARSPFFGGDKADVAFDRSRHDRDRNNTFAPNIEAVFTQSNARVLLGHAANGGLRFVALPTQVYAAPTGTAEFGLGPGMYHHFDVVMYAANLSYRLELEDEDDPVIVSSFEAPLSSLDAETAYGDEFLPITTAEADGLRLTLVSFAPVAGDPGKAPLSPAPLPGPAGAIYVLHMRNERREPVQGKVILQAGDLLIDHYEEAGSDRQTLNRPQVRLRQQTLILSQPYGAVGIHLHDGVWTKREAPFEAEVAFTLAPGDERTFEAHVVLGASYLDVLPTIYELHVRNGLAWLNLTAAFWRERLGTLTVDAELARDEAGFSRDIYVRSLLDNFNCLQTDAGGALLAHWQGAPSHGYGTIWGIDVEPTAVSVAYICPEITWAALRFFLERSRVPTGAPDHSVPILVAPIIIARQWLQVTGDVERLIHEPTIMGTLRGIAADLMAIKAPGEMLFPTRYSSDGAVGRRYDYGTNVKVWYAFDSMAYLSEKLGDTRGATTYRGMAGAIKDAIARRMTGQGPFGPQILGGTNLGEDPGTFYLRESGVGRGAPYYDGEDTSSMLAPIYGMVDFDDPAWLNYHRYARSLWCPNFDPEFGALRWSPRGFIGSALDGTAFFSRLAGSVGCQEMVEAMRAMWDCAVDEVTGSVFWWPHGLEYKRSLTRCSQGQGAFAWQYLKQWLGLEVDADTHTLTIAPRGLLTAATWRGFRAGPNSFDIVWQEQPGGDPFTTQSSPPVDTGARPAWKAEGTEDRCTVMQVTNRNAEPWIIKVGLRGVDAGAAGPISWRMGQVAPGTTLSLVHPVVEAVPPTSVSESTMVARSVAAMGSEGILFRRFGPEQLWGHWDLDVLWDPQAMPLTVRLLVANGTGLDWHAATVSLTCPEGWLAQGRPPRLWQRPDGLDESALVDLGSLDYLHQEVAPFWVMWPPDLDLVLDWHERADIPFHANTQPGQGLTLVASSISSPIQVTFDATLRAVADNGRDIERRLTLPILVLPTTD